MNGRHKAHRCTPRPWSKPGKTLLQSPCSYCCTLQDTADVVLKHRSLGSHSRRVARCCRGSMQLDRCSTSSRPTFCVSRLRVVLHLWLCRRAAAQLGRQLLGHHARYQAVAQVATSTAAQGVLSQWQRQAALAAAQRGLTSATLRYSAVQGALSFLGPVMWAWLAVDLLKAAVGTDYARVVRAVYILAQVRLVATQGWSNPEDDEAPMLEAGTDDANDAYFS